MVDAAARDLGRALGPLALLDDISLALNLQQIEQARADVRPFLRNASALDIWSPRYFRDLSEKVVYA